ncbi:MAG: S1C family serine protease [Nitrospirota bacterium]
MRAVAGLVGSSLIVGFALLLGLNLSTSSAGRGPAVTEDEKNNIEVYRAAAPAVVNITSISVERDFFFNIVPRQGTGSGCIINPEGYILTNHHVIEDAQRLEVTLADGSKWRGKLVGTDPDSDLAVIKIEAPRERLASLPMGDSNTLLVGQKVLAIGNPFGLGQTLSTGVVSSLKRTLRARNGVLMEDIVQTDASINPGNSGGALLDSNGRLIGVNTAIFSPTGASVGIGFAIPVSTAKRLVPELIAKGYYAYPWIGATVTTLVPEDARAVGLAAERGALIVETVRGGPTAKAGLQGGTRRVRVGNRIIILGGDVVVAIDGRKLETADDLISTIREKRPGDTITLEVYRGGLQRDRVQVLLEERPRQR